VPLSGLPAWLFHRAYHLAAMPTAIRRLRIGLDGALASLFRRELVSLAAPNPLARVCTCTRAGPQPSPASSSAPSAEIFGV
jgi:NADH dehydrogenase